MTDQRYYYPAGTTATGHHAARIDPETAGWDHSSLRLLELAAGHEHEFGTADSEWVALSTSGSCPVECAGESFTISSRDRVSAA